MAAVPAYVSVNHICILYKDLVRFLIISFELTTCSDRKRNIPDTGEDRTLNNRFTVGKRHTFKAFIAFKLAPYKAKSDC